MTANLHLQLNLAGSQTQITVTGAVDSVRTDSAQLGDTLGAEQMQETPLLESQDHLSAAVECSESTSD